MMMITEKDLRFLCVAESIAETSDYPRVHVGACVVRKGFVLAVASNTTKTHPMQQKYNKLRPYDISRDGLHAEVLALMRCGNEARGSTLYVFRRGNDGIVRSAYPCEACRQMILDYSIKRVVYTIENGVKEEIL